MRFYYRFLKFIKVVKIYKMGRKGVMMIVFFFIKIKYLFVIWMNVFVKIGGIMLSINEVLFFYLKYKNYEECL